jgi:hypothetical protein
MCARRSNTLADVVKQIVFEKLYLANLAIMPWTRQSWKRMANKPSVVSRHSLMAIVQPLRVGTKECA